MGVGPTRLGLHAPQVEKQSFKCYVEQFGSHSAHPMPSGEPGVTLEGVLTLVGLVPRVAEGEQTCGSEVPLFRKVPGV